MNQLIDNGTSKGGDGRVCLPLIIWLQGLSWYRHSVHLVLVSLSDFRHLIITENLFYILTFNNLNYISYSNDQSSTRNFEILHKTDHALRGHWFKFTGTLVQILLWSPHCKICIQKICHSPISWNSQFLMALRYFFLCILIKHVILIIKSLIWKKNQGLQKQRKFSVI